MNLAIMESAVMGLCAGIMVEKVIMALSQRRARKRARLAEDCTRRRNRPRTMQAWKESFRDDRDELAKAMIQEIVRRERTA